MDSTEMKISSVEQVYKNRSQFVLIGLTGRTGSGCTSSVNILEKEFKEIKPPKPRYADDNEERKYKIVYNYSEQKWEKFLVIHIKDIITSFIIENSYKEFLAFLKKNEKNCEINFSQIKNTLKSRIKDEYQKIYKLRVKLIADRKEIDGRDTKNKTETKEIRERLYEFYFKIIPPFSKDLKKTLNQSASNININQLESIDKEYEKRLSGNEVFFSQDIASCIQLADIHIHNPDISLDNYSDLKRQLVYYITLIVHPGLVPPSHLERCMQIAFNAKLNSGCLSRQVGAVITDKYSSIKAIGWNSVPEGQVPCILRSVEDLMNNEDENAYSHYESNDPDFRQKMESTYGGLRYRENCQSKLAGLNHSFCFKDMQNLIDKDKNQVHTRALHAEENAFLQITKYGGAGIKDGMLFVTASPCELCSKKAYQLGIKSIIYIDPYPGIAKDHILNSGSNKPRLQMFRGAIGRAYYQLYEPVLGYKDELKMLLEEA